MVLSLRDRSKKYVHFIIVFTLYCVRKNVPLSKKRETWNQISLWIIKSDYFNVTDAPTSSKAALSASASSLDTSSLTGAGAPSTTALASFKPRPVASRTALITLTFWSPTAVN